MQPVFYYLAFCIANHFIVHPYHSKNNYAITLLSRPTSTVSMHTISLVLVIQHCLGVRVQSPSPNFRINIQNSNFEFQKFLCSQYFIIQHFVLQIILYFLSQPESKLMTLIDKKISITFKSVNISKSSKVKKLKLFEIQLLRLFSLHKV